MKRFQSIIEYIIVMAMVLIVFTVVISTFGAFKNVVSQSQTIINEAVSEPIPTVIQEPIKKESHVGRTILIILGSILGLAFLAASGIMAYFFVHYRNYKQIILSETERCKRALDVREQLDSQLCELEIKDRYVDRIKVAETKTNSVAKKISSVSKMTITSFIKNRTWKEEVVLISTEINDIYNVLQEVEKGVSSSYFDKNKDNDETELTLRKF